MIDAAPLNLRIAVLVATGHPAQELPPHGRHDRFDDAKVHYGKWRKLKLSEGEDPADAVLG